MQVILSALIQGFSAGQVISSSLIHDFSAVQVFLSVLSQDSALCKNFQEVLVISAIPRLALLEAVLQEALMYCNMHQPTYVCIHTISTFFKNANINSMT